MAGVANGTALLPATAAPTILRAELAAWKGLPFVKWSLGNAPGELKMRKLLAFAVVVLALSCGVSAYAYFTEAARACEGNNC